MTTFNAGGYSLTVIGSGGTAEELNAIVTQEQALPEYSRILIEVPLVPTDDISAIAQYIQTACEENSILHWPEHPNTYTFAVGNVLQIAYLRPAGDVSPLFLPLIPILIGIAIIGPIIAYFVSPTFKSVIDGLIMLVMMMLMMDIMKPMLAPAGARTEPRPPIEQRISAKIESIGQSVARVEKAVKTIKEAAPSGYRKEKAARDLDVQLSKLEQYESRLTPEQLKKLKEGQRIVDELKAETQ
jgi:hypothetical protein